MIPKLWLRLRSLFPFFAAVAVICSVVPLAFAYDGHRTLAAKEGQQLFRVVNNAERAGIESSGKFTFPANGSTPTGQPGKFFWGSAEEAKQFQQIWYRGGEQSHILQTTIVNGSVLDIC